MRDRIFDVDLEHSTEKCMLAAVTSNGGCCRKCRMPVPALVDGHCTRCIVDADVNVLHPGFKATEQNT